MADARKTVSEIIEEMRAELREEPDDEAALFAPYIEKKPKKGKKASGKKKAEKKKKAAKKAKKKPAKKGKKKPAKKKKGKK